VGNAGGDFQVGGAHVFSIALGYGQRVQARLEFGCVDVVRCNLSASWQLRSSISRKASAYGGV